MATKKPVAKPAAKKPAPKKAAPAPKAQAKKQAKPAPKKAAAKKPAPKPVAKKAVAKKPVAKPKAGTKPAKAVAKPAAKKPAAKAPAKSVNKVVAKKAAPAKHQTKPLKKTETKKAPVKVAPKAAAKPTPKAAVKVAPKAAPVKAAPVAAKPAVKAPPAKPVVQKPVVLPKIHTKTSRKYEPDFTKSVLDQAPADPGAPIVMYSDADLAEFRELIQRKLGSAKKELSYLQGLITRKDDMGGDEGDNRYMTMEDGSLSMEREQLSQMASRQITFIDHLEKALMRIENKTYGICRITGKLIDKARLRAVPHATLSIEAKMSGGK